MRWIAKALVQRGLSAVAGGEALNYRLQRHVTHGLPASDGILRMHVDEACRHYDAMREHAPALDLGEALVYEFGAGWDLIGPLTLALLGVRRQLLVDIRENVRFELVNDTLARLRGLRPELERSLRELPAGPISSYDELEDRLGIRYVAPCDARRTPLPAGTVDVVSSTFTLEHIPDPDIAAILRESARLLREGGIVTCAVDMKDHYSYFDPRLGPYHFLTVGDTAWRAVNPPLHYQNRLRLPDYRRLFEQAGLRIVAEDVERPTPEQLRELEALDVAPRFRSYTLDELAAREVRLVAVG